MKPAVKHVLLRGLAPITDHLRAQRGSILCLHSVCDGPFPAGGFYPLRHLAASTGFLESLVHELRARGFTFVSLSEALQRVRRDTAAGRFVALTFDDGYADNWSKGLPLLARLGIPFTVFLTSGFIDRIVPMWWVGLEVILRHQDRLDLPDRRIGARTIAEKMAAFTTAERVIRALPREAVADFCHQVFELNSGSRPHDAAFAAALDWDQVRAMAGTGLVSFGCHTVTHPVLARLEPARCRAEIVRSAARIRGELGAAPEFFAYPYGGPEEVGVHAPRLVAESGFRAAFTTSRRLLRAPLDGMESYAIPRLVIEHEDLLEVRTHMSGLPWAIRDLGRRVVPRQADIRSALAARVRRA